MTQPPVPNHAVSSAPPPVSFADEWDAGDMGCGEVIIKLRLRFSKLAAGDVFRLVSRDGGAPSDLPAWCRMTGRRLLHADHPEYWIEQKQS